METSQAKSALVLSERTPLLNLRFVLHNIRLARTIVIAMYSVLDYSLLRPSLVAFYTKLNELSSILLQKFVSVYFSLP